MAVSRVWIPSPNYSSRGGNGVRLIVIHTAEGALTYQSLGSFFKNSAAKVSSHTGIDDTPNTVGEYVKPDGKAWTAANANPYSIQTELCGFAKWTRNDWLAHDPMLTNCAHWIGEESKRYGIPLVRLDAAQAQSGGRGVCGHVDLGSAGGGHWDPGPGFPWDIVMARAAGSGTPVSPSQSEPVPPSGAARPWPGRLLRHPPATIGDDVRAWQQQMRNRGWAVSVDGAYGQQSKSVCATFQREKGLEADGVVGPQTWSAAWTAPVT
jgi:N-acetyl-anhydromuramyl-L-alanine amidase AmpD